MSVAALVLVCACARDTRRDAAELTGGDPAKGRLAIRRIGCGGCHQIPGVGSARGSVGPSLAGIATRSVIAGKWGNSPENLVAWIRHPQSLSRGNVMPEMDVAEAEARDIAAYLYTLR